MGENLRKIRIARGLSVASLIEKTGITSLYMKETGQRRINEDDIEILSRALGCSKSEIIGESPISDAYDPDIKSIGRYTLSSLRITGIYDVNNIIDRVAISSKLLRDIMGSDEVILVRCDNNLMYPLIESGDDIFIDLHQRRFVEGGVYLVKDESDRATIKQATKPNLEEDVIYMSYKNTYAGGNTSQHIMGPKFEDNIFGKVVYCGKVIR